MSGLRVVMLSDIPPMGDILRDWIEGMHWCLGSLFGTTAVTIAGAPRSCVRNDVRQANMTNGALKKEKLPPMRLEWSRE